MDTFKKDIGYIGEDLATLFLRKKKINVIDRNFRCLYGEIDLIAKDGETIVFIEVKTRQGKDFGEPVEAVNFMRQRKMIKTAMHYMEKKVKGERDVRFDVVGIELNKNTPPVYTHIENAFEAVESDFYG